MLHRGRLGERSGADDALLLAWTAAAQWLAGDQAACRRCADQALEVARPSGNDRALDAARVAQALSAHLTGDPVALRANYCQALTLSERCGDIVQELRIKAGLAAALEQQGELGEALAVLGPAIAKADTVGYDSSLALALANEGALLHRLGRLEDAAASYRRAVDVYQSSWSRKVAYPSPVSATCTGCGGNDPRPRPHIWRPCEPRPRTATTVKAWFPHLPDSPTWPTKRPPRSRNVR